MACACKNKKMEKKYGIKEEESLLSKITRYFFKVIMFIIFVGLAIIVTPIMVIALIYNAFFKHNKPFILPEFLSKYMR